MPSVVGRDVFPATPDIDLDRLRLGRLGRAGRATTVVAPPLRALARRTVRAVRGGAFWLAVAMPLASLGVLLGDPLTVADLPALAALVAGHVAALVVGHGYGTGAGPVGRD